MKVFVLAIIVAAVSAQQPQLAVRLAEQGYFSGQVGGSGQLVANVGENRQVGDGIVNQFSSFGSSAQSRGASQSTSFRVSSQGQSAGQSQSSSFGVSGQSQIRPSVGQIVSGVSIQNQQQNQQQRTSSQFNAQNLNQRTQFQIGTPVISSNLVQVNRAPAVATQTQVFRAGSTSSSGSSSSSSSSASQSGSNFNIKVGNGINISNQQSGQVSSQFNQQQKQAQRSSNFAQGQQFSSGIVQNAGQKANLFQQSAQVQTQSQRTQQQQFAQRQQRVQQQQQQRVQQQREVSNSASFNNREVVRPAVILSGASNFVGQQGSSSGSSVSGSFSSSQQTSGLSSSSNAQFRNQQQSSSLSSASGEADGVFEPLNLPSGASLLLGSIDTSFSCVDQPYGYYADQDNSCRVFHVCNPALFSTGRVETYQYSFLCPEGSIFDQKQLTCINTADAISCDNTKNFYNRNEDFGRLNGVIV